MGEMARMLQEILGIEAECDEHLLSEDSGGDDNEQEEGSMCVICHRSLAIVVLPGGISSHPKGRQARTLPCGHAFHKCCLDRWFSTSRRTWGRRTCPTCRWE